MNGEKWCFFFEVVVLVATWVVVGGGVLKEFQMNFCPTFWGNDPNLKEYMLKWVGKTTT